MFLPVGVRGAVCQKVYAADFRPIGNLFRLAVIKTVLVLSYQFLHVNPE